MKATWMAALLLLAKLAAPAAAQLTIVSYTFTGDTSVATTGSSISSLTWNSGGAEGFASTFTGLGRALSVGGFQQGEFVQLTLDATGYTDIAFSSFRANGSTSAPRDWKLSYSLTGGAGPFTEVSTFVLQSGTAEASTSVTGFTFPIAANGSTSIVVQFFASGSTRVDGGASANGTLRLDSLGFTATAVPEPSTYAIGCGIAALLVAGWRRRQRGNRGTISPAA